MDSETVESLVSLAKASRTITSLQGMKAKGASGFLEAFRGLAPQHQGKSCDEICRMVFVDLWADDLMWGKQNYRNGAEAARQIIGDLHAVL